MNKVTENQIKQIIEDELGPWEHNKNRALTPKLMLAVLKALGVVSEEGEESHEEA